MSGTATTADTTTRPRRSTLDRATLMRLAATEYQRVSATLSGLNAQDWVRETDCPGWDVRAVAGHILGMAEMAASIREGRRQQKVAGRQGGVFIDAMTALQVAEHADLTPRQLIDRFRVIGPRAARARRWTPGLIRRRRMPMPQDVGGQLETWTVGYCVDTILTRDPWMHRVDISRATGQNMELTADHDGVLVADVVTEWVGRHGKPCQLHLTGPAGGSWSFGAEGPKIDLDAIEFTRILSGREAGTGLLATAVPF